MAELVAVRGMQFFAMAQRWRDGSHGGDANGRSGACGRQNLKPNSVDYDGAARLTTAWVSLLLAGLFEVGWALGLKYSDGLTRFWPTYATVLAIVLSFVFMGISLKSLPFGTAYALWAGIGAAGTVIVGMMVFGESADLFRIACLMLIIIGVVGLKLTSP